MPALTSSGRRASAWDWTLAVLLAVNLAWTTLCLGGYRPETMVVSSGLTFGALIVWLAGRALAPAGAQRAALPRLHPAGWWLLPFLVYAAANALWVTPVPWLGWADWLGWAQLVTVFWLAINGLHAPGPRRLVHATLAGIGVAAVALAVYQRFFDADWLMLGRTQAAQFIGRASGPFGIPNSLAALLLLLIPPALAAAFWNRGVVTENGRPRPFPRAMNGRGRPFSIAALALSGARSRRIAAGALAVIYLGGLVLTISRGAWLSLGVALALWPLLVPGRGWAWRVGAAAGLGAGALAIGLVLYAALPGVRARFDALITDAGERTRPIMWRGAWGLFQDAPVLGTGAGSYNVLFERHRPLNYRDEPQWAHNDYLNTLSDYGVVGFTLAFGAVAGVAALAWRALRRVPRPEADAAWLTRAGVVGLAAFALSLLIDFHLKIPALAMAVAIYAAELVRRTWPVTAAPVRGPGRAGTGAAVLGAAGLALAVVLPHYRAEAARYGLRRQIDAVAARPRPPAEEEALVRRARAAFGRATAINPRNAQAWADAAYAASLLARHQPVETVEFGREAEAAARRAMAESFVVPEFWWRLGVALDMQGRWTEAGAAFTRALELAPHSALAWYYQAYHLSLKPATHGLARAAAATCLRLDPGMGAADTLRARLVANP